MMVVWAPMSAEHQPDAAGEAGLRTGIRVLGLVGLVYAVASATHPGGTGRHLAALLLTVAVGAGWLTWLLAQHRDDRRTSIGSLCALTVIGGAVVGLSPVGAGVVGVAGLGAASLLEVRPALAIAAVGIAASAVAVAVTDASAVGIGAAALAAAAGVAMGVARRQSRLRVAQAAELALAHQQGELEHARAEVLAERNRVAREVHDVLAHTLSALAVQMEALDALVADGTDQPALRDALQQSRRLVVDGLDETRRAVRVLRNEPVALAEQVAALAAVDGADLSVSGAPRPLPAAAGIAVVRVAQEALTNARKHAPGQPVTVTLAFDDGWVRLVVDNALPCPGRTGSGRTSAGQTGGGFGIRGMRERVELLGGHVTAAPAGDRWRVQAELPA
jgi:signal transduction histidine kinase